MRIRGSIYIVPALLLAGCASPDSETLVAPETTQPVALLGDAEAGAKAFVAHCAECHASRDGFDLAALDFTSADVVRRALGHVNSAISQNIAVYIESFDLNPIYRRASLFQPGGQVGVGDLEYWVDAFGTTGWPAGLTANALRSIDPRDLQVPLAMPVWSLGARGKKPPPAQWHMNSV